MAWIKRNDVFEGIIKKFPGYNIDEKILKNWAEKGSEIEVVREKNRIGFHEEDIVKWIERLSCSFIKLDSDDYKKCFIFAVESYYNSITKSDFNRAKQRDVGEFLTNQIQGKLGEIAVAKLLESHGLNVQLDFDVTGQIPSQDISQISTRRNVWNNPSIKVSIKSTKFKNFLLPVPENEASLEDRKSDLYVLSQVGLFPNHILRIIKSEKSDIIKSCDKYIPSFDLIPCRVGGWIAYNDLIASGSLTGDQIKDKFGIQMASPNFIKVTGELSYDWLMMKDLIIGN
ncbi:MAG: hypothetical protein MUD12_16705 [Spirochaetes bacterium]|jgi:hypothetical protein|nr:hypothetical protein [Spirochaetota bacterium]